MMMMSYKRRVATVLGVAAAAICLWAPAAQGAGGDPIMVFTPEPKPPLFTPVPPPTGYLYGPCGLTIDSEANFYVADYYHHAVDVFGFNTQTLKGQLTGVDPLGGPCGLALDGEENLYVNNYHRNVTAYGSLGAFGAGSVFPLPAEDTAHRLPTGVAVHKASETLYVDHRTYVGVYDLEGNPIEEGGEELRIGEGTLEDGYGLAVSENETTDGYLYVPDAGSDTVKVYDPNVDPESPASELEAPGGGPFKSLRDSAIAIDNNTGVVYVAEDTQPQLTEHPQATIHAYNVAGGYNGHLKYNVTTARPPGLAVDNSEVFTKGRVYVTSGNSTPATVYAYLPGSTVFADPLPPIGFSASGGPALGTTETAGATATAGAAGGASPSPAAPRASASEVIQKGTLRVTTTGKLSPKKLPRHGTAPVKISVGGKFGTTDGTLPPQLKSLKIELNRHGRLETTGLPECKVSQIQPASTRRALQACRPALVGSGRFSVEVVLAGQEPYPTTGRLLLFNGKYKGKRALLGQIYSARPFTTSFVIPFVIHKRRRGRYGLVLTATLPKALIDWGHVTALQLNLKRRYGFGGRRRSVVSAGCPAPKGFPGALFSMARTTFRFAGGAKVSSGLTRSCKVRK